MAPRRSPQTSPLKPSGRRQYQLRSSPVSKHRKAPTTTTNHHFYSPTPPASIRPVLVPLHQNLRRLPSRLVSMPIFKESELLVGKKRKRVPSGTENALLNSKTPRGGRRPKRRKSIRESSVESEAIMDVDEEMEEDDDADHPTDDFFLRDAPQWRLHQLRKEELVRLYDLAGIHQDADTLTKPEIITALLEARDSHTAPPSSSAGEDLLASSEEEEEEETEKVHRPVIPLRRRATDNSALPNGTTPFRTMLRPLKDRSYSLGTLLTGKSLGRKRATSSLSSNESTDVISRPTEVKSPGRRKLKRVEFEDDAFVAPTSDEEAQFAGDEKENIRQPRLPSRHPLRRLRTRDWRELGRRVTPMRQAKVKVGSLAESSEDSHEDAADENEEQSEEITEDDSQASNTSEGDGSESVSGPSTPPRTSRRPGRPKILPVETPMLSHQTHTAMDVTPLKKRLRPRPVQIITPPPEGEGDDELDEEEQENNQTGEEGGQECDSEESGNGSMEENEVAEIVEPKRLRNGKIVGEGYEEKDDEESDLQEEIEVEDDAMEIEPAEEEEEDELDEDSVDELDVDLSEATSKGLARLRRDDLVKLCESRDLSADGTKMQLARSLIVWRDRQPISQSSGTSGSSASTVRPPSTSRPRRKQANGHASDGKRGDATPVLMRSHRVQADQPVTPVPDIAVVNDAGNGVIAAEPELELDLESLGLEDREIPPDKLVKLEKIGSGGFKDVFVGKLRGRMKVAIAEFRGQLTPMDIKELKLLSDFDHPNVVRFLGVSIPENTKDTPVMIISELCTNGDLFDYVRNVPPPTLHKLICLMLDIAQGLAYLHLHKPSIIHRDCKSSNILITAKITAKITDFGLAKVKQSTRSMVRSLVGTVNWQAPELWSPHPKYNHKVDVFSCACVFWEMLQWHSSQKKFPWEGMNEHAIYDAVGAKKQRPSVAGLRKQWCPEVVDLMERMWAQDPQDRPTMSEVVEELERLQEEY